MNAVHAAPTMARVVRETDPRGGRDGGARAGLGSRLTELPPSGAAHDWHVVPLNTSEHPHASQQARLKPGSCTFHPLPPPGKEPQWRPSMTLLPRPVRLLTAGDRYAVSLHSRLRPRAGATTHRLRSPLLPSTSGVVGESRPDINMLSRLAHAEGSLLRIRQR